MFQSYLLHEPCPHGCGWSSVDDGEVKTWGVCPARRVYAGEIDEWVAGQKMLCGRCKQESDRLKNAWQELRDYWEDDEASEVKEAEAAWKADWEGMDLPRFRQPVRPHRVQGAAHLPARSTRRYTCRAACHRRMPRVRNASRRPAP